MRLPFPHSIPLRSLLAVLAPVLIIQLVQGTDPEFASLMMIAQVAAICAFNILGGMTHMAGAFCLFAVLPNVTVPELTHLLLGQPGDYNMENPLATAGVCAVFFVCILIAAWASSLTRAAEPYLDRLKFSILEIQIVSVIAAVFIVGFTFAIFTHTGPVEDGSLLAAFNHFFPFFAPISIMLATHVRLRTTHGGSAISWYIAGLIIVALIPGVLSASKEGMLTPIFCWTIVVAAAGYRFSRVGTLMIVAFMFVLWTFVYPYSQNARDLVREAPTVPDKLQLFVEFLRDPAQFPDAAQDIDASAEFGKDTSKVNIIQRYSLLKSIDMLINADERTGYTSVDRYIPALYSAIPHAIWPDKPVPITSNELGHKAGFRIAQEDTTTGIAIGGPALFFDMGGWIVLVTSTIICFSIYFALSLRLVGTTKKSAWGLVPIGSEALLAGGAGPGTVVTLVFLFLGVFFMMVALLKIIGYVSQTLISRPISSKA